MQAVGMRGPSGCCAASVYSMSATGALQPAALREGRSRFARLGEGVVFVGGFGGLVFRVGVQCFVFIFQSSVRAECAQCTRINRRQRWVDAPRYSQLPHCRVGEGAAAYLHELSPLQLGVAGLVNAFSFAFGNEAFAVVAAAFEAVPHALYLDKGATHAAGVTMQAGCGAGGCQ